VLNQFKVQCGSCHFETNLGGLQVKSLDDLHGQADMILERIETNDLSKSMPQPTTVA